MHIILPYKGGLTCFSLTSLLGGFFVGKTMKDINIELQTIPELSRDAISNFSLIKTEAERRRTVGLTSAERLSPNAQVADYLERVATVAPNITTFTDGLVVDKAWKKSPSLIACIPVVGTGDQEGEGIKETLTRLNEDPSVQSGDVGILLFVNRPAGFMADNTAQIAKDTIQDLAMNGLVLDAEIPQEMGNTQGPFINDMATQPNQAPIGIIRDLISIAAMKLSLKEAGKDPPLLLQMDADFEGFMRGSMIDIINQFRDDNVRFLQCTSDWDSKEYPRKSDAELLLGAELMRELPQILKNALNSPLLPQISRMQIIFGEAIQRGIQVPQVERMEDIAFKGGYGLNRLAHDELDANIRQSALVNPSGVRSTDEVIFLWNNRRAVCTWYEYRQPPISQWINSFAVVDPVRRSERNKYLNGRSYIPEAVNKTLKRFPIPRSIPGVYDDAKSATVDVISRYIPDISSMRIVELQNDNSVCYLQIEF